MWKRWRASSVELWHSGEGKNIEAWRESQEGSLCVGLCCG